MPVHSAVNIFVPTYEPNPDHLRSALDSILKQTEQNWSALIHDDASTNNVKAMVEPYLKDPRFRFVRSEKRRGIGGNWNACLPYGDAPFIQYLFQDDVWEPAYLSTALKTMNENPSAGLVAMGHHYGVEDGLAHPAYAAVLKAQAVLPKGLIKGSDFLKTWRKSFLRPNMIGEPSFVLLRRSTIQRIGAFDEGMKQLLDVDYWARVLKISDWCWVSGNFGSFRVHAAGASAKNKGSLRNKLERLKLFWK